MFSFFQESRFYSPIVWQRILEHIKQETTLALKGSRTNKTRKQCEGYGPCQELNKKMI